MIDRFLRNIAVQIYVSNFKNVEEVMSRSKPQGVKSLDIQAIQILILAEKIKSIGRSLESKELETLSVDKEREILQINKEGSIREISLNDLNQEILLLNDSIRSKAVNSDTTNDKVINRSRLKLNAGLSPSKKSSDSRKTDGKSEVLKTIEEDLTKPLAEFARQTLFDSVTNLQGSELVTITPAFILPQIGNIESLKEKVNALVPPTTTRVGEQNSSLMAQILSPKKKAESLPDKSTSTKAISSRVAFWSNNTAGLPEDSTSSRKAVSSKREERKSSLKKTTGLLDNYSGTTDPILILIEKLDSSSNEIFKLDQKDKRNKIESIINSTLEISSGEAYLLKFTGGKSYRLTKEKITVVGNGDLLDSYFDGEDIGIEDIEILSRIFDLGRTTAHQVTNNNSKEEMKFPTIKQKSHSTDILKKLEEIAADLFGEDWNNAGENLSYSDSDENEIFNVSNENGKVRFTITNSDRSKNISYEFAFEEDGAINSLNIKVPENTDHETILNSFLRNEKLRLEKTISEKAKNLNGLGAITLEDGRAISLEQTSTTIITTTVIIDKETFKFFEDNQIFEDNQSTSTTESFPITQYDDSDDTFFVYDDEKVFSQKNITPFSPDTGKTVENFFSAPNRKPRSQNHANHLNANQLKNILKSIISAEEEIEKAQQYLLERLQKIKFPDLEEGEIEQKLELKGLTIKKVDGENSYILEVDGDSFSISIGEDGNTSIVKQTNDQEGTNITYEDLVKLTQPFREREEAAIKFQAAYRGYKSREKYEEIRKENGIALLHLFLNENAIEEAGLEITVGKGNIKIVKELEADDAGKEYLILQGTAFSGTTVFHKKLDGTYEKLDWNDKDDREILNQLASIGISHLETLAKEFETSEVEEGEGEGENLGIKFEDETLTLTKIGEEHKFKLTKSQFLKLNDEGSNVRVGEEDGELFKELISALKPKLSPRNATVPNENHSETLEEFKRVAKDIFGEDFEIIHDEILLQFSYPQQESATFVVKKFGANYIFDFKGDRYEFIKKEDEFVDLKTTKAARSDSVSSDELVEEDKSQESDGAVSDHSVSSSGTAIIQSLNYFLEGEKSAIEEELRNGAEYLKDVSVTSGIGTLTKSGDKITFSLLNSEIDEEKTISIGESNKGNQGRRASVANFGTPILRMEETQNIVQNEEGNNNTISDLLKCRALLEQIIELQKNSHKISSGLDINVESESESEFDRCNIESDDEKYEIDISTLPMTLSLEKKIEEINYNSQTLISYSEPINQDYIKNNKAQIFDAIKTAATNFHTDDVDENKSSVDESWFNSKKLMRVLFKLRNLEKGKIENFIVKLNKGYLAFNQANEEEKEAGKINVEYGLTIGDIAVLNKLDGDAGNFSEGKVTGDMAKRSNLRLILNYLTTPGNKDTIFPKDFVKNNKLNGKEIKENLIKTNLEMSPSTTFQPTQISQLAFIKNTSITFG